jgi:hypothetical protein
MIGAINFISLYAFMFCSGTTSGVARFYDALGELSQRPPLAEITNFIQITVVD